MKFVRVRVKVRVTIQSSTKMLAGQEPPLQKRKKYQDATKRIANIVQDYENREIVD